MALKWPLFLTFLSIVLPMVYWRGENKTKKTYGGGFGAHFSFYYYNTRCGAYVEHCCTFFGKGETWPRSIIFIYLSTHAYAGPFFGKWRKKQGGLCFILGCGMGTLRHYSSRRIFVFVIAPGEGRGVIWSGWLASFLILLFRRWWRARGGCCRVTIWNDTLEVGLDYSTSPSPLVQPTTFQHLWRGRNNAIYHETKNPHTPRHLPGRRRDTWGARKRAAIT